MSPTPYASQIKISKSVKPDAASIADTASSRVHSCDGLQDSARIVGDSLQKFKPKKTRKGFSGATALSVREGCYVRPRPATIVDVWGRLFLDVTGTLLLAWPVALDPAPAGSRPGPLTCEEKTMR